jgi:hypothetical protein
VKSIIKFIIKYNIYIKNFKKMDKVNLKRKLNKKEPKLSFGLALKNNVFQNFNPKFILLL